MTQLAAKFTIRFMRYGRDQSLLFRRVRIVAADAIGVNHVIALVRREKLLCIRLMTRRTQYAWFFTRQRSLLTRVRRVAYQTIAVIDWSVLYAFAEGLFLSHMALIAQRRA